MKGLFYVASISPENIDDWKGEGLISPGDAKKWIRSNNESAHNQRIKCQEKGISHNAAKPQPKIRVTKLSSTKVNLVMDSFC